MYIYIHMIYIYTHNLSLIYIHTYIYGCIHLWYVYMQAYNHTYIQSYIHTIIHTYIHTHTQHTHRHTHTHTRKENKHHTVHDTVTTRSSAIHEYPFPSTAGSILYLHGNITYLHATINLVLWTYFCVKMQPQASYSGSKVCRRVPTGRAQGAGLLCMCALFSMARSA